MGRGEGAAFDGGFDGGEEVLKEGVAGGAVPAGEVDGLDFAEAEGRVNGIEDDGDEDVAAFGVLGFVADEVAVGADAGAGPYDDDAFGGGEGVVDFGAPVVTSGEASVPPDGETGVLEGIDEAGYRKELQELRTWLREYDGEAWDRQIEADALAGRLDALADRALQDFANNRSTEL